MTTRAYRRIDFTPDEECRSHVCIADEGWWNKLSR